MVAHSDHLVFQASGGLGLFKDTQLARYRQVSMHRFGGLRRSKLDPTRSFHIAAHRRFRKLHKSDDNASGCNVVSAQTAQSS